MAARSFAVSGRGRTAVVAMVALSLDPSGGPVPLARLAGRQGLSLSHLERIFGALRRARLVRSVRGPGGGYRLARPAETVRVADILAAVEGPCWKGRARTEHACAAGDRAACRTRDLWDDVRAYIHQYLCGVTLADVCERPAPAVPERDMPPQVAAE